MDDLGFCNEILSTILLILDFIKINNFCPEKDTVSKIKDKSHTKKIFAKPISDKGFISKIHLYAKFLKT